MGTIWTDDEGREWNCRVPISAAERLRSGRDIDLLDPETITQLITDHYERILLLCEIHRMQIEERGLTLDDFAEVCFGSAESGMRCTDALMDALADFSRRLQRPALAKAIEKTAETLRETETKGTQLVEAKGAQMLRREMTKALEEAERKLG